MCEGEKSRVDQGSLSCDVGKTYWEELLVFAGKNCEKIVKSQSTNFGFLGSAYERDCYLEEP